MLLERCLYNECGHWRAATAHESKLGDLTKGNFMGKIMYIQITIIESETNLR